MTAGVRDDKSVRDTGLLVARLRPLVTIVGLARSAAVGRLRGDGVRGRLCATTAIHGARTRVAPAPYAVDRLCQTADTVMLAMATFSCTA